MLPRTMVRIILLSVCLIYCMIPYTVFVNGQNPILIIPGLTGSIIEVQAQSARSPASCPVTFSKQRMWIDLQRLLRPQCWKASMLLNIQSDGRTQAPKGITASVPDNGIYATSCIDPTSETTCNDSKYMFNLYAYLATKGYVRGRTLDAVPYDWRMGPPDFAQTNNYFPHFKVRVERMFQETGKKVTVIGHSMGAASTALFLNSYVSAKWRSTYIRQFISVAGAFGGSMVGMTTALFGGSFPPIPTSSTQEILRSFASIHSLAPADTATSKPYGRRTLVTLAGESFSVDQLPTLYQRLGLTSLSTVLNTLRGKYQEPPGVPTHCIYGTGLDTLSAVNIPNANNLTTFTNEYRDGDNTVTIESSRVCVDFAKRQQQPVTSKVFPYGHIPIIRDQEDVWSHIYTTVNMDIVSSADAARISLRCTMSVILLLIATWLI